MTGRNGRTGRGSAATIAAGIFDHRALVRAYGSAKDPHLEDSNVGA